MPQIWDFKDKFSVHFGAEKTDVNSPSFVPFGVNLAQFEDRSVLSDRDKDES